MNLLSRLYKWCLKTLSKNISTTSWRSVVLVGKTRVPGEKHGPVGSH